MKKEVEREWKGRISEAAYHSIMEYANYKNYPFNGAIQVNHYFDTDDYQLRKNNMMVRIRQKEDQYECTLKIAIKEEKELSQSTRLPVNTPSVTQEYTVSMDQAEAIDYLTGKTTLQFSHPIVKVASDYLQRKELTLHLLGSLTTERTAITINQEIEPLLLDRSEYLGVIDYEFEWETTDIEKAKSYLDELIETLKLEVDWDIAGKGKRFFLQRQKLSENQKPAAHS